MIAAFAAIDIARHILRQGVGQGERPQAITKASPMRIRAMSPVPQQPRLVALPVALLFGLALVMQLLALGDAQFDLGPALGIEIHLQRNQRHALALDGGGELGASGLCTSSLRVRLGSWLKRLAWVYSGI